MSPVFSIIAASASSVGKTFLIGLSGFLATLYPKKSPLIPPSSLSSLSRMTFNLLLLPLIFTGVASSVKLSELESLYPIILLSLVILGTSFLVTMALGCVFRMRNEVYFIPLCVASTFPNIVALPIIIFPTLCEYGVVQDLVREDVGGEDENVDLLAVCNKQVNAVVFTYFFGFSLIFWSIGHRTLRNLKYRQQQDGSASINDICYEVILPNSRNDDHGMNQRGKCAIFKAKAKSYCCSLKVMLVDILTSSGFVALILGFIISCIGPLQRALFDTGGSLRVFGSALESLSGAGTTFATIVVAASLVARNQDQVVVGSDEDSDEREDMLRNTLSTVIEANDENEDLKMNDVISGVEESNKCVRNCQAQDENKNESKTFSISTCWTCLNSVDSTTWRICIWQILSRLLVTPGIVFALLLKLDCSGLLDSVPRIAKLVLLINSAVPGALVVVVILKAEGLTEEAAAVSKTYLPSYTFSVFTLAIWSSLGLMAFRPDAGICDS
mmetsp:Transcript_14346/g.21553  ORF Transcript_14346/g.21553 Transcript_14346/m.21553 type:complete len:499 (-) Transcript_14346:39-1535(-)